MSNGSTTARRQILYMLRELSNYLLQNKTTGTKLTWLQKHLLVAIQPKIVLTVKNKTTTKLVVEKTTAIST